MAFQLSSIKKSRGARNFFCVLSLLLALNLYLATAHPLARVPVASLDRSEIFQAVNAYKNLSKPADIVLFGSSLMTAPVLQSETIYLKQPIAKFVHRRCHVMEDALAYRLGGKPSVFCLASGGEMASDVFLLTKNILSPARQPHAIIYGIAPRDFQDNLVPVPESTPTFQSLSTLTDLPNALAAGNLKPARQLDLILGRLLPFWRYKTDLRRYLTLRMKKYMERFMPWVCFDKYDDKHKLVKQRHGVFPEEAAGEPTAWPGVALDHLTGSQMLADYHCRYNPISHRAIDRQFNHFEHWLSFCRQHHMTVLVINMPISGQNRQLMPPGFYRDYLSRARLLCAKYEVDFADLNTKPWDNAANFVDTVHLEPSVSASFLEEVASITAHCQVALAVKAGSTTVAEGKTRQSL